MKIRDLMKKKVYKVFREYKEYHPSTWIDKEWTETKYELIAYTTGNPNDIKNYFKTKIRDGEVIVEELELDYDHEVVEVTEDLIRKCKDSTGIKKSLETQITPI